MANLSIKINRGEFEGTPVAVKRFKGLFEARFSFFLFSLFLLFLSKINLIK